MLCSLSSVAICASWLQLIKHCSSLSTSGVTRGGWNKYRHRGSKHPPQWSPVLSTWCTNNLIQAPISHFIEKKKTKNKCIWQQAMPTVNWHQQWYVTIKTANHSQFICNESCKSSVKVTLHKAKQALECLNMITNQLTSRYYTDQNSAQLILSTKSMHAFVPNLKNVMPMIHGHVQGLLSRLLLGIP